jgi:hypothetical protein
MKVRCKNGIGIQMERKENTLRSFPIRWQAKARVRSTGVAGLPHDSATIIMEGLDRRGMNIGKIFFEEGCSSELRESGSLIYRVFKLRNGCRKKRMIGIWAAQRSPRTHPWFRRFAQSEDMDQEDYFHDDD